jgi:hypothetical protein
LPSQLLRAQRRSDFQCCQSESVRNRRRSGSEQLHTDHCSQHLPRSACQCMRSVILCRGQQQGRPRGQALSNAMRRRFCSAPWFTSPSAPADTPHSEPGDNQGREPAGHIECCPHVLRLTVDDIDYSARGLLNSELLTRTSSAQLHRSNRATVC